MISLHRTLKVLILTPLCLILLILNSLGSEFTTEKLPIYPSGDHAMFDGTVAWYCGNDNWNYKICYYDGTQITEIAKPKYTSALPPPIALSKGEIAWKGRWNETEHSVEHAFYSWSGSTVQRFYSFRVEWTSQYVEDEPYNYKLDLRLDHIRLHDGSAVWEYKLEGKSKIVLWNGLSVIDITNFDSHGKFYPTIHENNIAWSQGNEILYWDGEQITQITDNDIEDLKPSLYKSTLAWVGDGDIYYWDGSTITQITESDAIDNNPSLYNGRIAWQSSVVGDDNSSEIYFWDGKDIYRITNNEKPDFNPVLYEDGVTWNGGPENGIFHAVINDTPVDEPSTSDEDDGGILGCFIQTSDFALHFDH